ncbi:MAG TPA: nitroreductase family deazaflavin-dependent oxidoreductase [Acidimicrobiales bacterium]|nr:nitroreductase family deazaflavin-dependent oxidoreductase [Acidimicrobiales bacterium]
MNLKDETAKVVNAVHRSLFSATGGRVGGRVAGMPALILTTTGRRSGAPRQTMLTAPIVDGDTVVLVGSYGGDDREPQWCRNLRANPEVEITMGGRTRPMHARIASPEERAELWSRVTSRYRGYAGYQDRTDRDIPLVIVDPREVHPPR